MKNRIWLALVLALLLGTAAVPAFAQQPGNDNNQVCTGGALTVEPGTAVNNIALFGCTGIVRAGATVSGSAVVLGGSLRIEQGAKVAKGVAILGGTVNIEGEVGGDVSVAGGTVILSDTSVVGGNVRISGGSLQRTASATVRGSVSQENNPHIPFGPPGAPAAPFPFGGFRPFTDGFNFVRGIFSALAFAALGAVLIALFPVPVRRVSDTAEQQFVPSVGVGCLTVIVSIFLAVGLAITIIGIPVVVLLAIVEAAAWVFGWISIGALAGGRILHALNARNVTPVLAVVVGVLVIALIAQIPVLGGLVGLVVGLLGLGAVILTRFGSRPYPLLATGVAPFTPGPAGPMSSAPYAPMTPAPGSMASAPFPPASSTPVSTVSVPPAATGPVAGLAAAPTTPPPAASVIVPSPESRPDEPRTG